MASQMREHILNVATDLFSTRGINATGVDTIVTSAGIAKMTLYKYFKSKEQLIVEYLQKHDDTLRKNLIERQQNTKGNIVTPLTALIDAVMQWIADPEFKGFAFINAFAEFPQAESNINQASIEFAQALRNTIARSAEESGIKKPEALALQLSLLIEGAAISEQMQPGSGAIEHAREAANILIRSALA